MVIVYSLLQLLQVVQGAYPKAGMAGRIRLILPECNVDLLLSIWCDIKPDHLAISHPESSRYNYQAVVSFCNWGTGAAVSPNVST
jgi:hypothetical protein